MTTDTQALVEYDSYQFDPDDFDMGLNPGDVSPPELRFSGKSGQFGFVDEQDKFNTVEAVFLRKLQDTRKKWVDDDDSSIIECRSEDSLAPVDVTEALRIGGKESCAACPYSHFTVDEETGKTLAPKCTLFENVLLASIPDEDNDAQAYIFSAKSTGLAVLKAAISVMHRQVGKTVREKRPVPGFAYVWTLKAGAEKGEGKRKYFPLTISVSAVPEVPVQFLGQLSDLNKQARDATFEITRPTDKPAGQGTTNRSPDWYDDPNNGDPEGRLSDTTPVEDTPPVNREPIPAGSMFDSNGYEVPPQETRQYHSEPRRGRGVR